MTVTLRFFFYCCALNAAVLAVFYPEQLLWRNTGFMFVHDTAFPLENVFSLVSQFFQGGPQLFNPFDGMNIAYNQLTCGLYTLSNVLTAALYIVVSPFLSDGARGFHDVFSVAFYLINMVLRSVGGYLLARKYTDNAWVIALSLFWLNIFLSSPFMNNGMMTNTLYGYLPLLMYFLLNFFEQAELKDLCRAALVMGIAVSNSLLFSLGYFYEVVHFIVVAGLFVYVLPAPRAFWKKFTGQFFGAQRPAALRWVLGTAGVVAVMVMPTILLAGSLHSDFFVPGSGLGGTSGRVRDALSIGGYFNMPQRGYAQVPEFLDAILNYSACQWPWTWMYLGCAVVFLCLVGAALSTNRVKYVVGLVTILVILVNLPAVGTTWWSLAHWINALTNPFHFLLRSFHMSALLWPYALFPLIVIGAHHCWNLAVEPQAYSTLRKKMAFAVVAVGGAVLLWAAIPNVKWYVACGAGLFMAFLILMHFLPHRSHRGWAAGVLLALLLAMDLGAYHVYVNWGLSPDRTLLPRPFNVAVPQPLTIEYQNPQVLPWRFFNRNNPESLKPLANSFHNAHGQYYRYGTLLESMVRKPVIYEPRPLVFKGVEGRLDVLQDMANQDRVISFSKGDMAFEPRDFALDLSKSRVIRRRNFVEYHVRLPQGFPEQLTSAVFTRDAQVLSLQVGAYRLLPVQGALSQAGDFDVSNIRKGEVVFAWPLALKAPTSAQIVVQWPPEFKSLPKFSYDELSFHFSAKSDGMLVLRYPYDEKWQAWVDGMPATVIKTNDVFMGLPLSSGDHRIEFKYWPQTPLRGLILISLLTVLITWFWVVRTGFKEQQLPV